MPASQPKDDSVPSILVSFRISKSDSQTLRRGLYLAGLKTGRNIFKQQFIRDAIRYFVAAMEEQGKYPPD